MKLFVSYTFGTEGGSSGTGNASITIEGDSRIPSWNDVLSMQDAVFRMSRNDSPKLKTVVINWWSELREDD
jgi:hypothetical protein